MNRQVFTKLSLIDKLIILFMIVGGIIRLGFSIIGSVFMGFSFETNFIFIAIAMIIIGLVYFFVKTKN